MTNKHKITRLTPEQKADLPVFRQQYLDMAQSKEPVDRGKLEDAIGRAYKYIGKEQPAVIVLESPLQCMAAIAVLKSLGFEEQSKDKTSDQLRGRLNHQLNHQLKDQLTDQLWYQLRGQLEDQLRGQLGNQLNHQLRNQLGDQLRDHLKDQLWYQLRGQLTVNLDQQVPDQFRAKFVNQLMEQLYWQVLDQIKSHIHAQTKQVLDGQTPIRLHGQLEVNISKQAMDQAKPYVRRHMWGSQDFYWIAWARFAQKIGVKLDEDTNYKLTTMEDISQQCEWWWPFEGLCIVSQRPTNICWDSEGRLHNLQGPAVEYADGYALYSIEGVSVPEEWIKNPEKLSAHEALNWTDTEQRAIACNHVVGWNRILDELEAVTIDKDEDPMIGELVEVTLPDHGKQRFLRVLCGTGRNFAIGVSNEYDTALEANAQTYGLPPEVYKQLEFRT